MKSSFSRISSRTSNFSTIMQLSRAKSRFAKVPINIGKSPNGRRLSVLDLARRERAAKVRYFGHSEWPILVMRYLGQGSLDRQARRPISPNRSENWQFSYCWSGTNRFVRESLVACALNIMSA